MQVFLPALLVDMEGGHIRLAAETKPVERAVNAVLPLPVRQMQLADLWYAVVVHEGADALLACTQPWRSFFTGGRRQQTS